jgi:hypothetical protein
VSNSQYDSQKNEQTYFYKYSKRDLTPINKDKELNEYEKKSTLTNAD